MRNKIPSCGNSALAIEDSFNSKHLSCLFRMQKSIDLKQKQRDEQVQKLKEKLEKVKDHDLWTTIASKTFEVRIQYYG